jgi:hypothetical protein
MFFQRRSVQDRLALVLYIGLAVVFLSGSLFSDSIPIALDILTGLPFWADLGLDGPPSNPVLSDPVMYFVPWADFFRESILEQHQLPLWNPYNGLGMPFMANNQSSIFFLPTWLFLVFDLSLAFTLIFIIKLVLAAFFTYLLARQLSLSTWPALTAGLIFAYGGYTVLWLAFPHTNVGLFLPLLLYFTERLVRQPGWRQTAALAAVVGLQNLAGNFEISVLVLYGCGFYFLYRLWHQWAADQGDRLKQARGLILHFTAALAIGFLISAAQLLPSAEYFLNSTRRVLTGPSDFSQVPSGLGQLGCLINPDCYGSPIDRNYNGPVKNYNILNTGYAGKLSLLLALVGLLWGRRRFSSPVYFGMLAGIALILKFQVPVIYPLVKLIPLLNRVADGYVGLWLIFCFALLAGFGLQSLSQLQSVRLGQGALIVSFLVILVDLFSFGRGYNPNVSTRYLYPNNEVVEFLDRDTSLYRILPAQPLISGQANMYYDRFSLVGSDVIEPVNHSLFLGLLKETYAFESIDFLMARTHNYDRPEWDLLNVKYVLSGQPIEAPGFEQVAQLTCCRIYQNMDVLPRAFIVHESILVTDTAQLEALLRPGQFDYRNRVIVDAPVSYVDGLEFTPAAEEFVEIRRYGHQQISLDASLQEDGFVVLSEGYFSGWRATVNGLPAEIYQANFALRALALGPGQHHVELWYEPLSVTSGLWISLLSSLLTLGVIGAYRSGMHEERRIPALTRH